jgi:RecA-family ATPase
MIGQDFTEFIFKEIPNKDFIIDQLISSDSNGYGVIAGRTGLGKTNMGLNLGFCLSLGKPFFGLATKKSRVIYLGFEGGESNL